MLLTRVPALVALLVVAYPTSTRAGSTAERAWAERAFERLGTLVGTWEGTFSSGRTHTVTYRLSAANTVLVETWALAPGRESITLYHLDGDALIATHYCPLGNQPTLQMRPPSRDSQFAFDFRSATNLPSPAQDHQHYFELRIDDANTFWRTETYRSGAEESTEAVTYRRVPSED